MKKYVAYLLVLFLVATTLIGCGNNENSDNSHSNPEQIRGEGEFAIHPVTDGTTYDFADMPDGTYPVRFSNKSMTETADGYEVEVVFFVEDFYDAVELSVMKEGDTIYAYGEPVVIKSIDRSTENIKVNGEIEDGGIMFHPEGGGVYRLFGLDDISSFTTCGKTTLVLPSSMVFTDYSDIVAHPDGYQVPQEELFTYLLDTDDYFIQYNTRLEFINGQITNLTRLYMP